MYVLNQKMGQKVGKTLVNIDTKGFARPTCRKTNDIGGWEI